MYKIKSIIFISLCFFSISVYSQKQFYVSTLAGDTAGLSTGLDSNAGYHDSTAFYTKFNSPTGLAVDTAGAYLYVVDTRNNLIRKVSIPSGLTTTIAGDVADLKRGVDSNIGYLDAANALAAKFNNPWGICVDDTGNVYVADTYNNVIRKIWKSGKVTTYAGRRDSTGTPIQGFVDGPNDSAEFNLPLSLTIDKSGNIYVVDNGNNAIRKISASGMVTTIAGQGPDSGGYTNGPVDSAQFYGIYGITLGRAGDIYVSQFTNNVNGIRRIYNGRVTTYAGFDTTGVDTDVLSEYIVPVGYKNGINGATRGDTLITGVLFNDPTGIAFDTSGNLLIVDEFNDAIRMFNAADSVVTSFTGADTIANPGFLNGVDSLAQFYDPMDIVADKNGNFYVSDLGNNMIRVISVNDYAGVSSIKKPAYTVTTYPNPCTDNLNVVSSFNGTATLLDMMGRVVWTTNDFKSPYVLSTSGFPPGVYFLRITSTSVTAVKKIEIMK